MASSQSGQDEDPGGPGRCWGCATSWRRRKACRSPRSRSCRRSHKNGKMIVVSIIIIIAAIQTDYNTNWKVIHRNQLRQVTFLLLKSGHFPMCSIYSKLKNMKFGGYIRFRKTIWAFWICQNTHQNSDSSHWIEASFIYAAIAVLICCFNRYSGNQGCIVRSSITAIWDCM